ncbi:hypothetical protein [Rathayibacter oskolensis]|uniref:hypothetical protein n=1 Tax=Rathayibacter oskolensis TaxID=1891671 RepID=UPI003F5D4F58
MSYRWGGGAEGGRELLTSIPMPSFWHAPTANERGWGGPFEDGQWLLASRYARAVGASLRTAQVTEDDSAVTVGFRYELPTTPRAVCSVDYRVTGDGRIDVTVSMEVPDGLPDLPEFGMQLTTSADAHRLRWYGDGPDECYSDRRLGSRLDVWESDVAHELPPYLKPQESGSRTGVRWAEVTDDDGWGSGSSARAAWSSRRRRGRRTRSRTRSTRTSCRRCSGRSCVRRCAGGESRGRLLGSADPPGVPGALGEGPLVFRFRMSGVTGG